MKRKSMRDFIRENRAEIDLAIYRILNRNWCSNNRNEPRLNDIERREWIENDESLYRWAKSEGVRV